MEDKIGEVAGKVWNYLNEEGKCSVSSIASSLSFPRSKVNMAIGWLAREDKLEFVDEGRGTYVRLD
ncbi:MAG: winged helix-turn-helix domain-containing protein [Candidatus Nanohaloarchaea archaeon]